MEREQYSGSVYDVVRGGKGKFKTVKIKIQTTFYKRTIKYKKIT